MKVTPLGSRTVIAADLSVDLLAQHGDRAQIELALCPHHQVFPLAVLPNLDPALSRRRSAVACPDTGHYRRGVRHRNGQCGYRQARSARAAAAVATSLG